MKYTLKRKNFNDFSVYEINKLPGRAYTVPYSSKDALVKMPFRKEQYNSDIVRILSGKWDFRYYASVKDLPAKIDTDEIKFDVINVPCTWQRSGYDSPAYINCNYAFDDEPPYVPAEQPVGLYRKFFDIEDTKKTYILSFLGVDPCIDLYINGKFAGYSEGSHNTAEFNITKYLVKGKNELVGVIHKWCNGTFLECQDMFRENGIFRDVLLYEMPAAYINDIYYKAKEKKNGWELNISYEILGKAAGTSVKAELYDGKNLIACGESDLPGGSIKLTKLDVQTWNAEIPKLYTAYFTLYLKDKELMTVRNYVGFKTVKINGDVFTVNGKAIKVKGVNHHDTNYKTGYVMTFADMEKDIKLMKSLNVNGVRTSHYPPDPRFVILCDIYGLYVIDEADIETHGCGCAPHGNIDLISHNPEWAPRYLDRVKRMYLRDRSRAGIIMWSLGNEAGGYACQDVCYKFLHKENPEIPVHYEGVIRTARHSYDVVSEMYTSHADVEKCGKHTRGPKYTPKPFYLCEYAHAMGEGPGGLEEYWQIIYSYENLMGGCIWEWADHSVYHPRGKYKFTYGGDHGEWRHDGCFCVDGLMYPDRRLHTGAKEMKNVYRPVRAAYKDKKLVLTNTNRFRNSSYITAVWECVKNGNILLASDEIIPDIEPCESKAYPLDLKLPKENCDIHINVYYYDGDNEIAFEQIALREKYAVALPAKEFKLSVADKAKTCAVKAGSVKVTFDKESGYISSITKNKTELINQTPAKAAGFRPNIYRAVTDNDVRRWDDWRKAGYADYDCILDSFKVKDKGNAADVKVRYTLKGKDCKKPIGKVAVDYSVKANGTIDVKASFAPENFRDAYKDIPRFGLTLEMPEDFKGVEYYGMGPDENLSDFYAQSILGIYETDVESMYEPYVRPQESGNRCGVRYVKISNEAGSGLEFAFKKNYFSFNARNYTQDLLEKAGHIEDLHSENTVAVNIDGFLRAAGTASCGPDVLDKYIISAKDGLEYSFTVIPF
ncbi:MAG: hypothetical protein IKS39_10135 [Clostridia bacterium]|nr:hypothetical protein [Clostridia bacterium]